MGRHGCRLWITPRQRRRGARVGWSPWRRRSTRLRTLARISGRTRPTARGRHRATTAGQRRGRSDAPYCRSVLDKTECPARQLVDDRWVWLPTVLAGRVFTHRLGADESAHDMLTVTPNLDPITALCEHEQYQRFADGSTARSCWPGSTMSCSSSGDIPAEVVDPLGALLLDARHAGRRWAWPRATWSGCG